MANFFDVLRSEITKTRRTWNFTVVLLFPVIITIMIFAYYFNNAINSTSASGVNHWAYYSQYFFRFYQMLYPLLTAMIAFSLSNIEHKNHGFKQLFTFPVSKLSIYMSKVTILTFWMLTSIILATGLLIFSGNILGGIFPELRLQDYNINLAIATFFTRTFLTLLTLIAIHFFLSIYWENFLITIGSACFLVIFGLVMQKSDYSYLIPYCNLPIAYADFGKFSTTVFKKEILWSLGYALLFFAGGYFIMARKNVSS